MFNRSDISMAKNRIGSMNRVLRVIEIIDNGCVSKSKKKKKILKLIFRQLFYLFHLNL